MLRALTLAMLAVATPVLAGTTTIPLGNGYGAMDAPRDIDSVGLAQKFCDARLHNDMSDVAPFFSDKLKRLLDARQAKQVTSAVPWQSYMERPTRCTLEVVNGADKTIAVLIKVTFTSPSRTWSDVLGLARTPDSWRLDNVFYETGGNLRFRLFNEQG